MRYVIIFVIRLNLEIGGDSRSENENWRNYKWSRIMKGTLSRGCSEPVCVPVLLKLHMICATRVADNLAWGTGGEVQDKLNYNRT